MIKETQKTQQPKPQLTQQPKPDVAGKVKPADVLKTDGELPVDDQLNRLINTAAPSPQAQAQAGQQQQALSLKEKQLKEWEDGFITVLKPTFDVLTPGWKVSTTEVEMLSAVYAAVAQKYIPDMSAAPEVAAALVTLAIIGPRLKMPRIAPSQSKSTGQGVNA